MSSSRPMGGRSPSARMTTTSTCTRSIGGRMTSMLAPTRVFVFPLLLMVLVLIVSHPSSSSSSLFSPLLLSHRRHLLLVPPPLCIRDYKMKLRAKFGKHNSYITHLDISRYRQHLEKGPAFEHCHQPVL
jgi:hypothetical protein